MDFLTQWLEESPGNARALAEESLIVDVAENLAGAAPGWLGKTDLANRLNVSKPRITKLLDGSANMTLRTLADIAFELDKKIVVTLCSKNPTTSWAQKTNTNQTGISTVKPARLTLVATTTVNVTDRGHHLPSESERAAA